MADEGFKRKLTAILSADVIGYSRLMRDDEEATVRDLAAHRVLISNIIQQHHGRVVDSPGDNILAEFASVVDAVNGAIKIQDEIKKANTDIPEGRRMEFRIGINLGDVIEEEERIYGDGVNIAARVEGLASACGIAISGTVYEHIKDKLSLGYHYLGEQEVKNIPEPVRVYRLLTEPVDAGKMIGEKKSKSKKWIWAVSGAIALIVLVVGALIIWNYYFRPSFEPATVEKMALPLPEKPSIAVLPFVNMSGDPEQDYIADGLTENIITGLSQIPEMFVIARNSVFTYKGKPVKVKRVSEELGVKYVLEGSIQKAGDKLRVNAQLIDALKGHHLWAERYDRDLKDLFALQDEITMKVLTAMEVKLTRGESARFYRTDSFEAWGYFVKGYSLFERYTKEDNVKARKLFEQALRIDPNYAFAMAFLAWSHFIEVRFGWSESPGESIKKAFEIAQKALALDENQPAVHSLFNTLYMIQMEHDKAIAEGKRAIELGPNDALAHVLLGQTMRYAGRFEEAASLSEKALRLQPYYPRWYLTNLAYCYYYVGKYEEAIDIIKQYFQLAKNLRENESSGLHLVLAMNYVRLDRLEDARDHAAKALRLFPGFSLEYDRKASYYSNPAHLEQQHEDLRKAGIPDHTPLKLPDKPSIAVLPFDNLSKDPEQEYFSDGLTDEIITTLSKSPRLFVIARESVFTYKTKQVPVNKVSRELGVRYVLEGSVRKSEDRLRITVQLIDATTGHPLWSERFEKPLGEIFAIQDEITLSILRALQVKLSEGEQARLIGKKTNNLDAYLKAIQAQEQFFQMNRQGSMRAKELAKESIDLDPNYAFPYTTLANAHMLDVWFNFSTSPGESMKLASDAGEKALTIDDSDPAVYSTLTNLHVMQSQYDRAIKSARQAIELSPGGARAHISMGYALYFSCRFEEAIPFMQQAIRLNPYPPGLYFRSLASVYRFAGRYDESLVAYKKALNLNPDDIFGRLGLTSLYALMGRMEDAKHEAKEVMRLHPDFSLESFAKTVTLKCQSVVIEIMETLRKAGLK